MLSKTSSMAWSYGLVRRLVDKRGSPSKAKCLCMADKSWTPAALRSDGHPCYEEPVDRALAARHRPAVSILDHEPTA